jgi:hypothetical protein
VRRHVEAAARDCADAVIGSGTMTQRVRIPGTAELPASYSLLAFNGTFRGRKAILARLTPRSPDPSGEVVAFEVRANPRTGTTTLVSASPGFLSSGDRYLSALTLELGSRYRADDGERRSYLSATCPAPRGFDAANFAFAGASYTLEDGSEVTSKLVRQCRVRR